MRALKCRLNLVLFAACILGIPATAHAASADYRELARHAGIIFVGTVEAVQQLPASAPDGIPTVRITFHVEKAVRGAVTGQSLTVMEWDPASAGERYRVGETLLLFLFAPSGELGLTSAVGGQQGRVRALSAGAILASIAPSSPPADRPRRKLPRKRIDFDPVRRPE